VRYNRYGNERTEFNEVEDESMAVKLTDQEAALRIDYLLRDERLNEEYLCEEDVAALLLSKAALEARIPRVLTLEEVYEISATTPLWVEETWEYAEVNDRREYWELFSAKSILPNKDIYNMRPKQKHKCGKRMWTGKPTADQMAATPWDGKQEG
jgi:hypothetical protein